MYKKFSKILTFHVEGEIEDNKSTPESIINNYSWSFEDSCDGNIQIFGHHNDRRGRISKMTKLPKIYSYKKKKPEIVITM